MHHTPPCRVRLIANPISGKRGQADLLTYVCRDLEQAGCDVRQYLTNAPGDATRLAAAAPLPDVVVAVGGDGTVRETAAGLLGTGIPLVVAPRGTENLVARRYQCRADTVAQTLRSGRALDIDVARLDGRPFLVVAGFGFDAEVVHRLSHIRRGHITHLSYVGPVARTFWRHAFPCLRVEADGELLCDEPAMVFVGNIPGYAMQLPILRDADESDGVLDVCVFKCGGRMRLLSHAWHTIRRLHVESPLVVYRQARDIRVSGPAGVPVEVDGDPGGELTSGRQVNIQVERGALRLLVPN